MKDNRNTACDQDILLEDFTAELTRAAYAVALRHGWGDLWLDLELDLWRVLTDTIRTWGRGSPRARRRLLCAIGPEASPKRRMVALVMDLAGGGMPVGPFQESEAILRYSATRGRSLDV